MKRNDEFTCDVVEKLAVLSTSKAGWTKEVRRISWNGGDTKFDIRMWAPEDAKFGRGIVLDNKEAAAAIEAIVKSLKESEA